MTMTMTTAMTVTTKQSNTTTTFENGKETFNKLTFDPNSNAPTSEL